MKQIQLARIMDYKRNYYLIVRVQRTAKDGRLNPYEVRYKYFEPLSGWKTRKVEEHLKYDTALCDVISRIRLDTI